MSKLILVTGAAGFIGSHACEALLARGDRVVGLDNLNDYYSPDRKRANLDEVRAKPNGSAFTFVEGDIRDRDLVKRLFAEHRFQGVIHLAAMAGVRKSIEDPHLYYDVNLTATLNLVDAAHRHQTGTFVLASTSSVYGNTQQVPFVETDPCIEPLVPYASSKRAAELLGFTYHHLYQMPFTALRFFTVYGPRGRPDMMAYKVADSIIFGREVPLYNNGNMHRDWTYVEDIVQGVVAAVDRPLGFETINLGRGQPVLLADFVAFIEELTGRKARLVPAPMPDTDIAFTHADITKARRLLGYDPQISVREGVVRFWNWYQRRSGAGLTGLNDWSGHRLVNAKTLAQRLELLRQALAADCRAGKARSQTAVVPADPPSATTSAAATPSADRTGACPAEPAVARGTNATAARPYWMATTRAGRGRQLHRYRQAQKRLDELLKHHAQHETRKAKRKRRRPEQVRICPTDPEAALGRDKLKIFRPLYNTHLAGAIDTPLILDYRVEATMSDTSLFIPAMQGLKQTLGHLPDSVLADGAYATTTNLVYCAAEGITMYAPVDDKPTSAPQDGVAATAKKPRQLGKEQFRWDAAEETYYCPEWHRLIQIGCTTEKREQDQELQVYQYRCPPEHCRDCRRAAECTKVPHKGRTIKRHEHEDKAEALRQRMRTPEGEALYKKRAQTIEPRFTDLKEHRGLRCFAGFGKALAAIQVGLLVLVHNARMADESRHAANASDGKTGPAPGHGVVGYGRAGTSHGVVDASHGPASAGPPAAIRQASTTTAHLT